MSVFLPCLAAQLAGTAAGAADLVAGGARGPAELYRHAQKFASLLAHTREQVEGAAGPSPLVYQPVRGMHDALVHFTFLQ